MPPKKHQGLTKAQWEEWKPVLQHWYLADGLSVPKIKERLALSQIDASPRQISSHLEKWGCRKNMRSQDWSSAHAQMQLVSRHRRVLLPSGQPASERQVRRNRPLPSHSFRVSAVSSPASISSGPVVPRLNHGQHRGPMVYEPSVVTTAAVFQPWPAELPWFAMRSFLMQGFSSFKNSLHLQVNRSLLQQSSGLLQTDSLFPRGISVPSLSSQLHNIMPEEHANEHARAAEVILHPSSQIDMTQEAVKVLLFAMSNNMRIPLGSHELILQLIVSSGLVNKAIDLKDPNNASGAAVIKDLWQRSYGYMLDEYYRAEPRETPSWRSTSHTELIQVLSWCLRSGQDPNRRPISTVRKSPLCFALQAGDVALVDLLLDHGASVWYTHVHEQQCFEDLGLLTDVAGDVGSILSLASKTGPKWQRIQHQIIQQAAEQPASARLDEKFLGILTADLKFLKKFYYHHGITLNEPYSQYVIGALKTIRTKRKCQDLDTVVWLLEEIRKVDPAFSRVCVVREVMEYMLDNQLDTNIVRILHNIDSETTASCLTPELLYEAIYELDIEKVNVMHQLKPGVIKSLQFSGRATRSHKDRLFPVVDGSLMKVIRMCETLMDLQPDIHQPAICRFLDDFFKFWNDIRFMHPQERKEMGDGRAVNLMIRLGYRPDSLRTTQIIYDVVWHGLHELLPMVWVMGADPRSRPSQGKEDAFFWNRYIVSDRSIYYMNKDSRFKTPLQAALQSPPICVTENDRRLTVSLLLDKGALPVGGEAILALRYGHWQLAAQLRELFPDDLVYRHDLWTSMEAAVLSGSLDAFNNVMQEDPYVYSAKALLFAAMRLNCAYHCEDLDCTLPELSQKRHVAEDILWRLLDNRQDDPTDVTSKRLEVTAIASAASIPNLNAAEHLLRIVSTPRHTLAFSLDPCKIHTTFNPLNNMESLRSPIELAIIFGSLEGTSLLLDSGFKPDTTCLYAALGAGGGQREKLVALLLAHPETFPEHESHACCGLLKLAIRFGYAELLDQMLDFWGMAVLLPHSRSASGSEHRNTSIVDKSQICEGPIDTVIDSEVHGVNMLLHLLNRGLSLEPEQRTKMLLRAAFLGQLGMVRILLHQHADINSTADLDLGYFHRFTSLSVLGHAAVEGRLDMVSLLLSRGAKTENEFRVHYSRAVAAAILRGHHAVANYLKCQRGWTEEDEAGLQSMLKEYEMMKREDQLRAKVPEYENDAIREMVMDQRRCHLGGSLEVAEESQPLALMPPDVRYDPIASYSPMRFISGSWNDLLGLFPAEMGSVTEIEDDDNMFGGTSKHLLTW